MPVLGIEEIMDKMPTYTKIGYADTRGEKSDPMVIVVVNFGEKGFGFGEIQLVQKDAGVFIDSERMGKARVKTFLARLVDEAIDDTDQDPDKHRLYNEVMSRHCGEGCVVCYPKEAVIPNNPEDEERANKRDSPR